MKKHLLFFLALFIFSGMIAQTGSSALPGDNILAMQSNFVSGNLPSDSPVNTYSVNTLDVYPTPGIQIDAFPNSEKHYVWISVKSPKHDTFEYTLKGKTGKFIESGKFHTSETISMANYGTGTYFITVTRNKSMLKSFLVIKH
jgi:hypothetical protein